jgi:putative ABC transport system permease protein
VKMFEEARIGPNFRLLKNDLVGDIGDTLWVLMGTLSMVLLIACANVANLLLVRAEGRHQELALRAALGAGAGRIARELLVESLVLGVAGGLAGLALAHQGLRVLATSELANLPRVHEISIDPLVLGFTLVISLGAGIAFGVIPAWRYARPQLSNALRGGGRAQSASRERRRARSVLVVVQVALALILLVSSALMIRTFQALRHVDPGFTGAHDVQALRISIPFAQVREPERVLRMQQEIAGRIAAIPGVASAAIVNMLPMTNGSNDPIYAEDRVYREGTLPPIRRFKFVSPGYVATIGSRLVAGRDLQWGEIYGLRPVALVSENLARELWNDPRAAVGKRIRVTLRDNWSEVVGVVADLRDNGLGQSAPTIVYWPLMQKTFEARDIEIRRTVNIVARTPRAGTAGLLEELRRAVSSVNANLPVAEVRTLEAIYERALSRTSFTLALLAIAGAMALLLGVVGIYGVVSYSVSQRTREIGIRLALGAPGQEVRGMFLRHGLALSGIGAACGLAAAFALTRLMRSLLFDVSPADPLAYGVASVCLMAAAALACYLPARKATKVDPAVTLRSE